MSCKEDEENVLKAPDQKICKFTDWVKFHNNIVQVTVTTSLITMLFFSDYRYLMIFIAEGGF